MIPFYEIHREDTTVFETGGLNFAMHLHADIELLYLKHGHVTVFTQQNEYTLTSGDLFIAFPNIIHGYHTDSPAKETSMLLVIFQQAMAGENLSLLQKRVPMAPVLRAEEVHADVTYAMYGLLQECCASAPNAVVMKAFIQLALSRIHSCLKLFAREADSDNLLARTVTYVSENYRMPLTLDVLSREIGISRYHLSRLFNSELHMGFREYINSLRVNLAHELLGSTNWSVQAVGEYCGFETPRSFNRAFLRVSGCTPRDFRNSTSNTP